MAGENFGLSVLGSELLSRGVLVAVDIRSVPNHAHGRRLCATYQPYLKIDDYVSYLGKIDNLLMDKNVTIKVEKYESILNWNDGTVHIFYAKEGSPSFDEHSDPVDLILQVTHGIKTISLKHMDHTLLKGDSLYIPAGTLHRATNKNESIMLSWGLNDGT